MVTMVEAETNVLLVDGANIALSVQVGFEKDPRAPNIIKGAIFSHFMNSGEGITITLDNIKNDIGVILSLERYLKVALSAKAAQVISLKIITPPIESFWERSKEVFAILATGETVKLKFASPKAPGIPAPGTNEIVKVHKMLTAISFEKLNQINDILEKTLYIPNRGWNYELIGLELIKCKCS